MRKTRTAFAVFAVTASLLLAACTGSSSRPAPERSTGTPPPADGAVQVRVSGARPASAADYPAAENAPDCDPRQSLTPLQHMPEPGRMPAGSTMERIQKRGYLIVGVDQNTRYFAELDRRDGRIKGFDIAMASLVAQAVLGDPEAVRYRVVTQAQRIPVLEEGAVDIVIDTMTITCERKTRVAFSSDYYTDWQKVLVPYTSPVTGMRDLHGKRVCTVAGTTSIAVLRDHPAGVIPYAVENWTDCLVALQQGEVDAVSTTSALLHGLADQDRETKVVGEPFTNEPHGMAVPLAHTDFVRFLNALLERIKKDGTWQRLYDEHVRQALDDQPVPSATYAD